VRAVDLVRRQALGKYFTMAALAAIALYQRHISPHKGYCCAYRLHTGRASCSALAGRAIRRYGIWQGLAILRLRFAKCGVAYRRYAGLPSLRGRQAGFCDAGCDLPCDIDAASCAGDVLEQACSPCGSDNSRKRRGDEYAVRIPARRYGKNRQLPDA